MKKYVVLAAALAAVTGGSAVAAEDPCSAVVADTVAEMRAGAGSGWDDDVESLVRAAAGAACVKSRSVRYAAPEVESLQDTPVAAGPSASAEATPESDDEEDDGSFSIGGLKIRGSSGSPSQKSFERARDGG